jgi:hypothetical protein
VTIVLKSGSLNLLEPSEPVQACNGAALPLLSGILEKDRDHKKTPPPSGACNCNGRTQYLKVSRHMAQQFGGGEGGTRRRIDCLAVA